MERLPDDIVLEILSWFPITSLVQSKSACRAWRSMMQGSFFAQKHLSHTAQNDPGIIFQSLWPVQNQYYFLDLAAYNAGIKNLKKMSLSIHGRLVGSCNGLLCFYSASAGFHICNPLSNDDSIKLPNLPRDPESEVIYGFGFSPTTREYKLVIVYQSKRHNSEVRILTIGDSRWRSLGMVPYRFDPTALQVIVNGRHHWISNPGIYNMDNKFISFDLTSEKFQEVPKPDCRSLDRGFYELVALQGHLSAVTMDATGGLEIWVMKKYNIKESWIKEFNIGGCLRHQVSSTPFQRSRFRAICCLRSGEILLEKMYFAPLVLYDPVHETFKNLTFEGLPYWMRLVLHVGSLVSI